LRVKSPRCAVAISAKRPPAALDAAAGRHFDALNTDPQPLPGADELIAELERRGIPWAVATSSQPEQVTRSLSRIQGARGGVVMDASRVSVVKPAPDGLRAAAAQLRVDPSTCSAVGDFDLGCSGSGSSGHDQCARHRRERSK
jgi:beta-phosphoglucomutase-like phosphatase (HAD superfamily)